MIFVEGYLLGLELMVRVQSNRLVSGNRLGVITLSLVLSYRLMVNVQVEVQGYGLW